MVDAHAVAAPVATVVALAPSRERGECLWLLRDSPVTALLTAAHLDAADLRQ
jgi:hypothetical protein